MGVRPPNIALRDTTDVKWHDYYSLKSEYTILYFWDPECGHCKKTTPKLEELYTKKFKGRNIEIFSVGKAVGEDFPKWKKFIKERALIRVKKNLKYLQKKEQDFTVEEMRELIAIEEKEIISKITTTVGIGSILALLGIPNI